MSLIKSFGWAIHGLRTVWKEERTFKIEVVIGLIALIAAYVRDLSIPRWLFLVIMIAWVLMSEIVNTAIEDICNKIEPHHNPVIGKIKDIMAGYVLISSIAAIVVGAIIFFA